MRSAILTLASAGLAMACAEPPTPPATSRVPTSSVSVAPAIDPAIAALPPLEPPTAPVEVPPWPAFTRVATPTPLPADDLLARHLAPQIRWADDQVVPWPDDVRYVRAHADGHDVVVLARAYDHTYQSGCLRGSVQRTVVVLVDGVEAPMPTHPDEADDVLPLLYARLISDATGWRDLCADEACLEARRTDWEGPHDLLDGAAVGLRGEGRSLHLLAVNAYGISPRRGQGRQRWIVDQLDAHVGADGKVGVTTRTLHQRSVSVGPARIEAIRHVDEW